MRSSPVTRLLFLSLLAASFVAGCSSVSPKSARANAKLDVAGNVRMPQMSYDSGTNVTYLPARAPRNGLSGLEPVGHPVLAALMTCVRYGRGAAPNASDPNTVPPGLIEGLAVNVKALPEMQGRAFSYRGMRAQINSCGIAMYGPVADSLQQEIKQLIESEQKWVPAPPDYWMVSAPAADKTYWGTPGRPTMFGVLLLTRSPTPNAPTLEVQVHYVDTRRPS